MTAPDMGLRVAIDATGSKTGADLHVKSIEDIKRSTPQATTTVDALSQALRRMGLAEDLVQKSVQRNAAMMATATPTVSALATAQTQLTASTTATVAAQARLTPAIASTAAGTGKLTNALQTLAFSATGLPGPLGRVAGALGSMALGGPVTVAVIAGLAAIGGLYATLTGQARDFKKSVDDLVKSLDEQVRAGNDAMANMSLLAEARDKAIALSAKGVTFWEAELRVLKDFVTFKGLQTDAEAKATIQAERDAAAAKLAVNTTYAKTVAEKAHAEVVKKNAEEEKGRADKYAKIAADRLKSLTILGDAERQHALEQAANTKEELAALIAIRDAKIAGQVITSGLKGPEAELLRMRLTNTEIIKEENALLEEQARLAKESQDQQAAFLKTQEALIAKLRQAPADLADPSRFGSTGLRKSALDGLFSDDDARDILKDKGEKIKAREKERAGELADIYQDAFKDFFARGLKDWDAFFFSIQQLAGNLAQRISKDIAAGLDVSQFSKKAGQALGGLSVGIGIGQASGSPLAGALGGAAAGFAVGGPIGAVAGAVGGFVSGLLSSAAKAREAAKQMAESTKAFNAALSDFAAIANPRGALGDAMANLTRQAQELQRAAMETVGGYEKARQQRLGGGDVTKLTQEQISQELARTAAGAARDYLARLLEIRKAYDENAKAVAEQAAAQKQQFLEDLTVRNLRARGLDADADALAFLLGQERELRDVRKAMGKEIDEAVIAQLEYVQAIEREARAKAIATRDTLAGLALSEREANLRGDTLGGLAARRDQQIAEANRQRDTGGISNENYQRLIAVIFGEFTKAVQEVADAAEAATLALFTYNRTAREDLGIRLLMAEGRDAEAASARAALDATREYAQAVKDGADATTLALLAQVQAAEANRRAADAAKEMARAMEEQARAFEDLTVRMLRASGQGGAADEGAQLFAQQEERRRAIEAGRSQAFLDELERVQAKERAFADAARRTSQQRAFDDAFPTTSSRDIAASATTVNLAVGLSESTGGRIAGLLASQLAYQASLPRMERLLEIIASRVGGGTGSLDPDDLDAILAGQSSAAAGAAGVLPSNR